MCRNRAAACTVAGVVVAGELVDLRKTAHVWGFAGSVKCVITCMSLLVCSPLLLQLIVAGGYVSQALQTWLSYSRIIWFIIR